MSILIALILSLLLKSPSLMAAELSNFHWDDTAESQGLDIQGGLPWDPEACDFTKSEHALHAFPVFSYKGPSGKPLKDPTGAYCFRLQLPPDRIGSLLHFSMIRIFGTASLFINGEQVWFQDEATGPERLGLLYEVRSENLQVELRLHCKGVPTCGFRGALHIKNERQGSRTELLHYSYDLLALAGILSCLFYHLIFALLRRRSSTALFLSLTAIALFLRLGLTGHGQLHFFLDPKDSWYWRLEMLAAFLLLPANISLVRSVFEKEAPHVLSMLGWVVAGASSFFLILDQRIFAFLLIVIYIMVIMNLINYFIVIPRALRAKRTGAVLMIVAACVTFSSTLFEVLNSRLNIEMHPAAQPLSYLAAMIFQSVLLATRINDAFILAEEQESEIKTLKGKIEIEIHSLDQKIMERTMELRTIFQSISTGILWISRNEQSELKIHSEYSDHLRETLGFDIQHWQDLQFFLSRMRLAEVPPTGPEIAAWFEQHMHHADELDRALEKFLGGLRIFEDKDRVKHLKFNWIPILESGRVTELFIFVFDVSHSIEMQELARARALEIEALRELTQLPPSVLEEFHAVFDGTNLDRIRRFAGLHQLEQINRALDELPSARHRDNFVQAYQRVLKLLAERQLRALQQASFDHESFLQLPDWQNLPVDSRGLFQELLQAQEKISDRP